MNDAFNPSISRRRVQSPPGATCQFPGNAPTPAKPTMKRLFIGLTYGIGLKRILGIQQCFSEKISTVDRMTNTLTSEEVGRTRSIPDCQ
jgi:hypothetical protein